MKVMTYCDAHVAYGITLYQFTGIHIGIMFSIHRYRVCIFVMNAKYWHERLLPLPCRVRLLLPFQARRLSEQREVLESGAAHAIRCRTRKENARVAV